MDFVFFLQKFCSHGFRFRLSQLFFCLLSFLHGFLFLFVHSHGFVVVVFSLHFCWFALPSFFFSLVGMDSFCFCFICLFRCSYFTWILFSVVLSHGFCCLVFFRMDSVVWFPFAWILLSVVLSHGFCCVDFVFLFHGFMFCVAWFDCVAFGFILRTSFSIHLHLQCIHL